MGRSRQNRRAADPTPLLNPVQRHDLRRLLPLVPNERRLLVIAAFLGMYLGELYDRCGLTTRIRTYYAGDKQCATQWVDLAMAWCWRISQRIGIPITELWEIDDDFDPARAVPLRIPGPGTAHPLPRATPLRVVAS